MNKPLILIIEDNPISRKVLKKTLESENYDVVEAENGFAALREITKQKFDLIIQDLFLPDMDGFALNKKMREIPHIKNIPIFALSGFLSQLEEQASHTGFTTFLLKPIEPTYLLEVIRAHLPLLMPSQTSVGKGKYILIADDNPIQLKLFAMQLKNLDFEVETALDGVIAFDKAKKRLPDAIISDILMPNMDGFTLCSEIKRDPVLCKIPVILLTSHYLADEDLELARKVGASAYLTRTPELEKLIAELVKILNVKTVMTQDSPLEMTEDVKERHMVRAMRQLEQQVMDNSKLAQRCAMLMSQLYLIGGIANTLTNENESINESQSLKEGLYFCLDATGISKGALYIRKGDNAVLAHHIGFEAHQSDGLKSLFGLSSIIKKTMKTNKPIAIPSTDLPGPLAEEFMKTAQVKSALIVPLFSGTECLGVLLLGSDLKNLSDTNTREFIRTLGMQFGQSIALTSAFEKLGTSEKRYRQLAEISPDAIFIQQEGRFVYVNQSGIKLLNATNIEEIQKYSFYDFFSLDYQNVIKEYVEDVGNQTSKSLPDGKILNTTGDVLDVEIVVSPFIYQEKPAVYMIMRDITDRKKTALHLEILYSIAWILAESATLFVATAKILKIICESLHWECGSIWAVDKNANVLVCTRTWQKSSSQSDYQNVRKGLTFSLGVELPGQVWKDRRAIWISNIYNDAHFTQTSLSVKGMQTAVAFPIIYENEVLGVIEFFSMNILQPDQNLLLWFESVGNQLGLFLKRKHMEEQMLYLAEHDVLTGLSNRSLLEQYLRTALIEAKEKSQKVAVLFLDLDHFKYINDSMGHESGDLLLKEISERFLQCLRPDDRISRLGGDEFVIILPNIHEKKELLEIIARLEHQLSNRIILNDKEFLITASIGVSFYPENGDSVQGLIKGADIAMYAAKGRGRNNIQFCTREMTANAENRGILQNDLQKALSNREFVLHYQPKIAVNSQKIVGMEALIRWEKPDGILLPGSFISAIENSDLIIPVSEWVIQTAFSQNKKWQMAGLPIITMSVNLSVRNLNQKLLHFMESFLSETNLIPNSFEVELTESVLMENVENNILILKSLKEMGIKISIDDFGTGYSSLSYLKRFPIDTIKIDQSFVRDIATDPGDAAIVTAIIAMAHSLGFNVIAEGVETMAQVSFLSEHHCDEIQGFYYSRALPVGEATRFLMNKTLAKHMG